MAKNKKQQAAEKLLQEADKMRKEGKTVEIIGTHLMDFTEIIANAEKALEASERIKGVKTTGKQIMLIAKPEERLSQDMGIIMAKIVDICVDRKLTWYDFREWMVNNATWIKAESYIDEKTKKQVVIDERTAREKYAYNLRIAINSRESLLDDSVQTMLNFLNLDIIFVDRKTGEEEVVRQEY